MNNMFGMFGLLLGVYVLYGAITGKGQLFQAQYIKEGQEKLYVKRLRIVAAFLGPVMVASGIIDLLNPERQIAGLTLASNILLGVSFVLLILLVVLNVRMTDRARAKQDSQQQASRSGEKSVPREAFEFDDEDK